MDAPLPMTLVWTGIAALAFFAGWTRGHDTKPKDARPDADS